MPLNFETFVFDSYHFDPEVKKLTLKYSFDDQIHFEEEFIFDFEFVENYSSEALENAFFGLFVMAGISYFKSALPPKIKFKTGGLNPEQKQFFEKIYLHGLGEFFYQNNIDPRGKINFPEEKTSHFPLPTSHFLSKNSGTILPIGGGKDSITTAEILKSKNEDFETWSVGNKELINVCCEKIGKNHLKIHRKIAPELLDLNEKGALNGHVPISAILAFCSVATAILRGKKNIVFSNEHSANEANLEFHGMKINHQYSKTLEFEKDFQNYVQKFISPDIHYFSFLRPLTELKIAQIFCENSLEKYQNHFASCNRNFHLSKKAEKRWCGLCPKCAFVFALFSPFLPREKLIDLFGGNLFANPELTKTFEELLGIAGNKPFECVGEIAEVRQALTLAKKSGQWPALEQFKFPEPDFDFEKFHPHAMPTAFEQILKNFLQK